MQPSIYQICLCQLVIQNLLSSKPVAWLKNMVMKNCIIFVNYSDFDYEILNKAICDLGKVTKSARNLKWSFWFLYLGGSNKLRTYLFFIFMDNLNRSNKDLACTFFIDCLYFLLVHRCKAYMEIYEGEVSKDVIKNRWFIVSKWCSY